MSNIWSRYVAWLLVLGAAVPQAFGQATSGTITGLVSDPSGAPTPGAAVGITEINKGVTFTTMTNGLGYYTHARVPAGSYILKVEKTGFKTFVRENILLTVDSTVRVDVDLALGSVAEEVVVTS